MDDQKLTERESNVFMAKLAEQAERYDEMADYMKLVGKDETQPLSVEERNLLSVAFKNAVGSRRVSLRVLASICHKQKSREMHAHVELASKYHKDVEKELHTKCYDILDLLDKHLIANTDVSTPAQSSVESAVFYLKMKGDYYRYLSEFCEETRTQTMDSAKEAYQKAHSIAFNLNATHPIRLGLALNYSVFLYEIMNDPDQACAMAKSSFDDAIAELDSVTEESYKDSTLIMQLLRDNLTLWNAEGSNVEEARPEM